MNNPGKIATLGTKDRQTTTTALKPSNPPATLMPMATY
jgi:hypothetical protein